ncbi:MAG: 2-oxoglutarate dehydrogenase E1 component [Gammaproteobacteria bacterium]|nr:2-oxoglutarate dehydrogenase E1 component [Gammaproteobacteria bacterium]
MHNGHLQAWIESSHLSATHAAYIEDIYDQYLTDPVSVDAQWRAIFDGLPKVGASEESHSGVRDHFRTVARQRTRTVVAAGPDTKQVRVLQLINAYRFRGHQHAELDPLGMWQQEQVADLDPAFHELTAEDFHREFSVGSFAIGKPTMVLGQLVDALKRTYCGAIGAEYMHLTNTDEKRWLQQRLESILAKGSYTAEDKLRFAEALTAAEGLERYIGTKFPGAKRFSLEGGDALIPMLKELIRRAGEQGTKEAVIGMAHRGRLNVLVNVLGKKPSDLFDAFAGKHDDHPQGSGDVKYHMGFSSDFATPGGNVHLALAFNPSHLEIVNPVVMGSVRARQERIGCTDGSKVLPITIHGDSAIAGQGVVQETFNLSKTRAFGVGGTVRIVVNNQIGFTTSNPQDTRSTQYCTDIAKMVHAPIFHVNADDVEAVVLVAQIALDFRNTFKRDVLIDLICYRRHGHNEADEPGATQPLMYQKIRSHSTARQIYAERLVAEKVLPADGGETLVNSYRDALDRGECVVKEWRPMESRAVSWAAYVGQDWDTPHNTAFNIGRLLALGEKMCEVPEGVVLHSRVKKLYEDRVAMMRGERLLDWGAAETLAYATLVADGYRVRLTGQDSGRGTFFHRHAVLYDQKTGSAHIPLRQLAENQAPFDVYDSVLSEEAVLAFEYGYATASPEGLTIWEAQFGDFANGAQVVIDQFLSSGEQKWGRLCGLVMLLPHGYEGQGPEHSSARLERFLQLCADHNMQVCVPSTPAQVFHMLRRQVLRPLRRPLVVMSPKSLLRHPAAISSLDELSGGCFQNCIGEVEALDPAKVKRVVFCSGKVYYELVDYRRKNGIDDVAVFRIEQLYPFPHAEVAEALAPFVNARDFVWCQEEPQNQGAWYCSQHHFWAAIPQGASLKYAGRAASAAPACGYAGLHLQQQQELIHAAFN